MKLINILRDIRNRKKLNESVSHIIPFPKEVIDDDIDNSKNENEKNILKNCKLIEFSGGSIGFYRKNELISNFDTIQDFCEAWFDKSKSFKACVAARNSMDNHGGTNGFDKKISLQELLDFPPANTQNINYQNDLISYEKENEGSKNFRYRDTKGHWTIGIGFNLEQPLAKKCFLAAGISLEDFEQIKLGNKGITDKGMYEVFKQYEKEFHNELEKIIPNYDSLPSQVQLVCFDLIYNLGTNGFLKFKNFISAIKNNNFSVAKDEYIKSKMPRTDRFSKNIELLSKLI